MKPELFMKIIGEASAQVRMALRCIDDASDNLGDAFAMARKDFPPEIESALTSVSNEIAKLRALVSGINA